MLVCRVCGNKFDPAKGVGHLDDHVEVCPKCNPKFTRDMQLSTALRNIGNHVIKQYRLSKNGQRPMWAL